MFCPMCGAKHTHLISRATYQSWIRIDKSSEEYRDYLDALRESRIHEFCDSVWEGRYGYSD